MKQRLQLARDFNFILRGLCNALSYKYFDVVDEVLQSNEDLRVHANAHTGSASINGTIDGVRGVAAGSTGRLAGWDTIHVYLAKLQAQLGLLEAAERARGGDLIGWLRGKGAMLPRGLELHVFDHRMTGLRAAEPIEVGEVLMQVRMRRGG